ncbi:hypothetical protein PIB30_079271 [Stylosanthes scabra]|uniref:Uncharacterized protein n=1 Tax=Stylosanthes scabra TaxID=79078 RepID=A0ABU6SRA8_9FABA|nr:hypothetical protein [Stylosanthes scabra]
MPVFTRFTCVGLSRSEDLIYLAPSNNTWPLVKGTSSGSGGALFVVVILKLIAQGTFPSGRWSFIPISKEEGKVVVFGESCFKDTGSGFL